MNLLKSPLRRTTAVLAGAFIGMAGAVAVASPALAHYPELVGTPDYVAEGGWKVDWELTAIAPEHKVGTIVEVTAPTGGSALTKIVKDATIEANAKITETQSFPVDVKEATLEVTVQWKSDAATTITSEGSDTPKAPQPIIKKISKTVHAPEGCKPPVDEKPIPEMPGNFTPILVDFCDAMEIGADNPADGAEVKLEFKTSKGEERTLVIAPGQKKTEVFSAAPGFKITLTVTTQGETASIDLAFKQPKGCDAGTGGGGPQLPVTGAAAGTIAGGAGLLLAIGGVLFFLARRRKVKFTA